jgi:Xaa-Pro aminopeptidase
MNAAEQVRRMAALRAAMARHDLTVWLVPRGDEHQLSYVLPGAERLAWISGFTGSAGLALVGRERAALFVDGRYTLQAKAQAGVERWEHHHVTQSPPAQWLDGVLGTGARVGYDPRLHTPDGLRAIGAAVKRAGGTMCPLPENLIDMSWTDRPPPPHAPVALYPEELAGESRGDKRRRIAQTLRDDRLEALVISAPENLVWLLNLRGGDLPVTPLALGFAVLRSDAAVTVCLPGDKVGDDVRAALAAEGDGAVTLVEPAELAGVLAGLTGRVRVDQVTGSEWIVRQLEAAGASPDVGPDPCTPAKACKNPVQVAGMRAAHVRDGVALVRLLAWLEDRAPGAETEWTVAQRIAALRAEGARYRGPSFNTIAAVGPNSAHCHYSLSEATALPLGRDTLLLVDSGGQYLDGTTDVTRTIVLGTPTDEMRRRYTQVLKGHLALGAARFPRDTNGNQLDVLARQYLWQDGVDYDHGTGHGVGSYLGVHEGPQSIAKKASAAELRPGMVLSNEPGYYKAGAFGIRIENLVVVTELDPQSAGGERGLGFETLTLAPYERRLVEVALLTAGEIAQVDTYHARVRETLSPLLDAETAAYLAFATAPLLTAK